MVGVPVLAVVAVLAEGRKQLVALELCSGGESFEPWKRSLDDLGARGLAAPCSASSTATRACAGSCSPSSP